jgi:asparagine synthase (glutamine-hydrolysing)
VDVVDAVVPLPVPFKIHRGLRKRLLIDAHRELLPDGILQRGKMGFEVPMGEFLRGPLGEMFRDTVTREAVEEFGLIDYQGVQRTFEDHCAQRGEHADLLYALLVLCRWQSQSVSSVASPDR